MTAHIPVPNTITLLPFGLPGRVYRSPLPFGNYDPDQEVLSEWIDADVKLVYSLIAPEEWLQKASQDARPALSAAGIRRVDYPVEDFGVPRDPAGFQRIAAEALGEAARGQNLAVHCNAGWGRTGLFLAEMAIQHFSFSVEQAVAWLRQYVPPAVENPDQYLFLISLHKA